MKIKLIALAAMVALSACKSTDNNTMNANENLAGGWQSSAVSKEITAAAEFAKQYLNKADIDITSISDIEQQVVAGMNYSFLLKLADNSEYLMKVFHDLDDKFHVTESQKIK